MFFEKVISYKGAWKIINENHKDELNEIQNALPLFFEEFKKQKTNPPKKRCTTREIWEGLLTNKGWETIDKEVHSDTGKRIRIDSLGPVKKDICASIPLSYLEFFNRWFFVHTIVAAKYGIVGIPILLIPTSKYTSIIDDKWLKRTSFEKILNQLLSISPLNHAIPFLIIGFTEQYTILDRDIIELEVDPLTKPNNRIYEWETKTDIPRSYHQIGFEILSFFSTYLREQFPKEDADITVKQAGNKIKILVESQTSKPYIIEQAFGQYYEIITEKKQPNEFVSNKKLLIGLETQLEMKRVKIEMLNKFEEMDNKNEKIIERLLDILDKKMDSKQEVYIENTNNNYNENKFDYPEINQHVKKLIDSVNEISELTKKTSEEYLKLNELAQSLESISDEQNKEVIKNSSAMKKVKNLVEMAEDKTSKIGNVVNTFENGWNIIKKIITFYNHIARICGFDELPWNE